MKKITKKSDWLCRKSESEIRQLAEKFASGEKKTGQTTTEMVSGSMVFVSVSAAGEHF
jgi:hypothetical protein